MLALIFNQAAPQKAVLVAPTPLPSRPWPAMRSFLRAKTAPDSYDMRTRTLIFRGGRYVGVTAQEYQQFQRSFNKADFVWGVLRNRRRS